MRSSLSHLLLAGAVSASLASCVTTPPEETEEHRFGHGSVSQETEVITRTPVTRGDTSPDSTPSTVVSVEPDVAPAPSPTPMPAPVAQDYPVATPVDGKPGYVNSPYSASGMVDVRGYPPGTEVRDPYSNKIFLVP